MASLQELRKRLKSIQSTGQLAGAMRTAATAKYSRLGQVRSDFLPYARACQEMMRLLGRTGVPRENKAEPRDCVVILGGNRGLCGGFNAELLRFLEAQLPAFREPRFLVCGRKAAAYLKDHGIAFEDFPVSDVPAYQEVKPLADRLRYLYTSGEAERVLVVYQSFHNMLNQIPTQVQILPEAEEDEASGQGDCPPLLLPDLETIRGELAVKCLGTRVFELVLENAVGAQAATMMSMRSACDNAEASAADLEITINRRRQAEVTSSVIETASGSFSAVPRSGADRETT